jgi:cytochrome c oxidase cbb3-type subunit 3
MSTNWTLFISILTIANIAACFWLLWWTRKKRPPSQTSDSPSATTGHTWDGDLQEYNKPLPKWWLNLFYATIVFSIGYLVAFPGLGAFAGTRGWSSAAQHDADAAAAEQKLRAVYAKFDGVPVDDLASNAEAVALGRSVFANHCAQCHGSDARGAKGFPNLTDADWQWGGDPETVLATIQGGRQAAMPPWGAVLGDQGVTEVATYVLSLSGHPADAALAAAGKARYDTLCVACHGPEGKGNPLLGAPNLTDATWLYGSDFATISDTIRNGRNGMMPAQEPIIGPERARLAAAWVLAQSRGASSAAAGGAR